ncbi:Signal transduction histidine kinase, glucose-6-phosphate specific [Dyella jiangningensis]|uniref:MASE1 domain-containing protein n=1 Tax=Dyella sp. AtDHG13 TaxID=1938897 RepID=UPI0008853F87|nr:MASE1 domain-containing protein [Dyella sp. AtDHG13]PXV60687.1 glucose-6-phosphate-specific signal transduction histidine kinase [Dyella sp. AtDHG13]SDJ55133.1 Signal transduction histidine kinase, glucose-6-phosphate specific [Dyella jiangningensis]
MRFKEIGLFAGLGCAYGFLFWGLRTVTPLDFNLAIGLRFAALMLLPRRLWPVLLAGEWAAILKWATDDDFSSHLSRLWVVVGTFFPFFGGWAPVTFLRRKIPDMDLSRPGHMGAFLGAAFAGALCSAAISLISVLAMGVSEKEVGYPLPTLYLMYLTGAFLGIITVAPFVRAVARWWIERRYISSATYGWPFGAAAIYLLCGLIALRHIHGDWLTVGRCLLFAPLIVMPILRGWPGAAVAGLACSAAVHLTQRTDLEHDLLAIQDVAAVATAGALIIGAYISIQKVRDAIAIEREIKLNKMVRRLTSSVESQFRYSASIIEAIRNYMHETEIKVANGGDRADMTAEYWRLMSFIRTDLRLLQEVFHPDLLDVYGMGPAIASGPIHNALLHADVAYDHHIPENTSKLSRQLQMSIYRLAYESVSLILNSRTPERIMLRVRTGRSQNGRAYAALTVRSYISVKGKGRPATPMQSTGLGIEGICMLAESFSGQARYNIEAERMTMVLFDDPAVDIDNIHGRSHVSVLLPRIRDQDKYAVNC